MSEILDFYQHEAKICSSSTPWVSALQKSALLDFERLGFPTRHHEDWKYTTVDTFLQQPFSIHSSQDAKRAFYMDDVPVGRKIALVNGEWQENPSQAANWPAGVIVQPLKQALVQHPDKLQSFLGRALQHEHGFQALNTAMLQEGLFIYLPKGICLDEPLHLSHWQGRNEQAVYVRHLIVAEAQSQLTLIEDYQGDPECCYFTNTITEIYAAQGAMVNHYKIQRESKKSYHIGHLAFMQSAKSKVESHSLSLGGKLVRSDTSIHMQEPHAQCLLNGIYAPTEGQHIDHHTVVRHDVPDCQSKQDYKGILSGRSRAVFNGKVVVAKDAQHTEAKQQNKNVLLSLGAEVDTKPQLEIFADDVVCTHGATVGRLDEDALFYLATRGIDYPEASRYLINAFAAKNLQAIPIVELADWMSHLLNQQLG